METGTRVMPVVIAEVNHAGMKDGDQEVPVDPRKILGSRRGLPEMGPLVVDSVMGQT